MSYDKKTSEKFLSNAIKEYPKQIIFSQEPLKAVTMKIYMRNAIKQWLFNPYSLVKGVSMNDQTRIIKGIKLSVIDDFRVQVKYSNRKIEFGRAFDETEQDLIALKWHDLEMLKASIVIVDKCKRKTILLQGVPDEYLVANKLEEFTNDNVVLLPDKNRDEITIMSTQSE